MPLDSTLLDILVCPRCYGSLTLVDAGSFLLCPPCKLKFPIRDGVPTMIVSEATDLEDARRISSKKGGLSARSFRVSAGPNKGMVFHLELATCKAVGRALSDPQKTAIFNVDLTLSLDSSTRGLIEQYVSKQFRKSPAGGSVESKEEIGAFKRTSDVILDDASVSRLHAMLFFDEVGVGILDLVSKNGTFVNGEEVESRLLKKGDVIEVGDTKIIFEG